MFIIADYLLERKGENNFFVNAKAAPPACPSCGGRLCYRDCRKRIMRHEGGGKDWLLIRRFRCKKCHHYHNELPDCVLPYKHYETEVISGVLDGIVTADDADSENYPSLTTMQRWLQWFIKSMETIKGLLRSAQYRLWGDLGVHYSEKLSLDGIRTATEKWLEVVMRIIYNSGGYLPAERC